MKSKQTEKYLTKLGEHIKQLRESQGLSYRELSARCSIEPGRIHDIETGKLNITVSTVVELAAGLGVHPTEILNFE